MLSLSEKELTQNITPDAAPSYLLPEEKPRWHRFKTYDNLLMGNHERVFLTGLSAKERKQFTRYIIANFCRFISKISADFLFGEHIVVETADKENSAAQAQLDLIVRGDLMQQRKGINELGHQTAFVGSAYGNTYWQVIKEDDDELGRLTYLSPMRCFPIASKNNADRIEKYLTYQPMSAGQKDYVLITEHRMGENEYTLYEVTKEGERVRVELNELPETATLINIEPTKLKSFDIISIPNIKDRPDTVEGTSDYVDIMDLQAEINRRISQSSGVFDKHFNPKMSVPAGVLDKDGRVRKDNFELIESTSEDGKLITPQYITFDSHMKEAVEWVEKVINLLYLLSETSNTAAGDDQKGGVEAFETLRMRMMRTLAKINRKRTFFEPAVRAAITTCFTIAGKEAPEFTVQWQDGIPVSDEDAAKKDADLHASGAMSLEKLVRRRPDMAEASEEDIMAEVERIRKDQEPVSPAPTINV